MSMEMANDENEMIIVGLWLGLWLWLLAADAHAFGRAARRRPLVHTLFTSYVGVRNIRRSIC